MNAAVKRVAVFLPNMGGGGAERVGLAIIRDFVDQGHEVDLVLVEARGELLGLVPPGVTIVDLYAGRYLSSLLPLVGYLRERRPDVIHAIMWPITIIAIIARRLAGSRAKLMVSDQVALSKHMHTRWLQFVLRWTTKVFYPMADSRVVCSGDAADDLAHVSGIPRGRFEVIFNPIAAPAVLPKRPDLEQFWGEADGRIITVGALKHQKNHALLLRAFAELRQRRRAKLMILGEGPLRPILEALAAELGITDSLLLPGFSVDPWAYLGSADLFVLSSDYEGFPLALVEAMAAGLRVVSTNCDTGPREILDGGRYGRLVPCGDASGLAEAIDKTLSDARKPEQMRARAESLSGQVNVERYRELMLAGL